MTDTNTTCQYCKGSGVDPKAIMPIAFPHFIPYVAAMNPCPKCHDLTANQIPLSRFTIGGGA